MLIAEPGIYEIDAIDYHADPCPTPSLNNSLIASLLECPRLAWEKHPRLNPAYEETGSRDLDLGSVAHALLLGRGKSIVLIDAADYRTNDAKAARDNARAFGKIPVLPEQMAAAEDMQRAAIQQLRDFPDTYGNPFGDDGKSEVGLFWRDGDAWGRSLIDRLRTATPAWECWDYKTTKANINPEAGSLGIHVVDMGYDTQMAMQERGLIALYPGLAGRLKFRLLFQQSAAPYLISIVEPDPATMTIARKKVERAFQIWNECLTSKTWPGYPNRIMPLRHAEFLAARWMEREVADLDAGRLPPAPQLKRPRGRPRKSEPVSDLSGG